MKIIAKSNFDNEMVSDLLIAENMSSIYSALFVNFLNSHFPENHTYIYLVVPDDYKLYEFIP